MNRRGYGLEVPTLAPTLAKNARMGTLIRGGAKENSKVGHPSLANNSGRSALGPRTVQNSCQAPWAPQFPLTG